MHFCKNRNKDQRTLKKTIKKLQEVSCFWGLLQEPQWALTCFLISSCNLGEIWGRDLLPIVQMEKLSSREMVNRQILCWCSGNWAEESACLPAELRRVLRGRVSLHRVR